jgi:hypothetical protein
MTKLIAILILVAALFVGWRLFVYWDHVKNEKAEAEKQAAAAEVTSRALQGVPFQLENSLEAAERRGGAGLRDWLKAYGDKIQDPRKAWIELDYVVFLGRDNVVEAKRVFANVKARTPHNSPIWPRIEKLAKTYE